jgi:hypothetical protein
MLSCSRRNTAIDGVPGRLAEDAEELTDNWAAAEADNRLPSVTTELQRLLSEHQEICRRIIDVLDTGQPED